MQDHHAHSRLERLFLGAALAVPASNRAQRRRIRATAIDAALFLNSFVEKHTALAAALAINTAIVLLLCLYTFRSPKRHGPISFTWGNSALLDGAAAGEESGDNSDVPEENPAQGLKYAIPAPSQPEAAISNAAPRQAVIETLASSRFLYGGSGRSLPMGGGSGGRGDGKKIGGLTIRANRLGVILDVSGSMADDSERVNQIIAQQFENAICIQVEGCDLLLPELVQQEVELPFNFGQAAPTGWNTESTWPEPKSKSRKKEWPWAEKARTAPAQVAVGETSGTIQALTILASRGVDAVYWFCDLQDLQSNDGLREVDRILSRGRIRLYLQSQELEPGPLLREIVERSGGAYSVEF